MLPLLRLFAAVLAACLVLPALAPAAAPPGDAVYRRLCRAIEPLHVRALFAGPVAAIRLGGSSDCAFHAKAAGDADAVRVFLRVDDGDQALWLHKGDRPYGAFTALQLPGRRAKWGYLGGRLPSVVDARSGSFTCTVIPTPGAPGLARLAGSPRAAARHYAERSLVLCADVFAAYR